MKKSVFIITGFMLFSVGSFAQNAEKLVTYSAPLTAEPALTWLNGETIDMGKIEKGVPKTVTFEFKNTGNAPLLISSAKGSCGCTNVEFSKQAIQPNGKGFVKATYNAANVGAFNKSITVVANTSNPNIQLNIKGEVK